ncbi:MAG: RNA-binding protein [Nitrospira sp.]|nr:RNA-binding protein [Nitrospira sp.]
MTTNIHISGLSFFCTDDELRQAFAPFGRVVLAQVLRDAHGHSLGLGIVHMSRAQEVENIFNAQQHFEISGMRVDIWEPSDSAVSQHPGTTQRKLKGVLTWQPLPRVKRSKDYIRPSSAVRATRSVGFVLRSV